MEGAPIPYDASIWDAQRGHANYLAQALQQPLILPKDMESIRRTRQPDLFMSLKRDLAMVSCTFLIQVFKISSFYLLHWSHFLLYLLSLYRSLSKFTWSRIGCVLPITSLTLKLKHGAMLKSSRHSKPWKNATGREAWGRRECAPSVKAGLKTAEA